MNTTNRPNGPTNSVVQPASSALRPADPAKRPFVPPQLIKQGQVAAITQGGGFGSDNITPPDP